MMVRWSVVAVVLFVFVWLWSTYYLFVHRPTSHSASQSEIELHKQIHSLRNTLDRQINQTKHLLHIIKQVQSDRDHNKQQQQQHTGHEQQQEFEDFQDINEKKEDSSLQLPLSEVMPVLMFACNRPTVSKAIDTLLQYRTNKQKFPIIVSQDCGHQETKRVILGYDPDVILIEHPNQGNIDVPVKEKKFKGYFKIARHYEWALRQIFEVKGYSQVIVVEDDLEVAPDFFHYFEATLPILRADDSLMCVSAWNDNGKEGLIDHTKPELLYRTDFFGGLGWMLTSKLWSEMGPKWPKSYWDDWFRLPEQRRQRACIRPEISRTKTFGKVGVSNGLFYDKHLKFIKLNEQKVDFTKLNLDYLKKENYDRELSELLNRIPVVTVEEVKTGLAAAKHASTGVRLLYHNKLAFKKYARALGIMDDFKAGVPRMAYQGVVSVIHNGLRVYVAPSLNWQGYDPKW